VPGGYNPIQRTPAKLLVNQDYSFSSRSRNERESTIQVSEPICPWWLAYTFDNPLRLLFHNPEKIFGPLVSEGMTVLDVGCGMGFFSIGLAKLVGSRGRVIAADVQQKMLDTLKGRADKARRADRIRIHRCEPANLGLEIPVDFILAFWMVHEVPNTDIFFRQLRLCLKAKGKILMVEPKWHVSSRRFQETLDSAQKSGLGCSGTPFIRFSRAAVLQHNSGNGVINE
jgi:SAM-dependent methyltransferase